MTAWRLKPAKGREMWTKDRFLHWLYQPTTEHTRAFCQEPGRRAATARAVRALKGERVLVHGGRGV